MAIKADNNKETNPLLSIIIPMYKVEEYIRECMDSIIPQLRDDVPVEVIAVDDGSPDRCGEIVEEYSRKDSRIKVFRQENLGPGGARNTGLDHATGEYVVFVDADDILAPNALEVIVETIKKEHPEAIQLCGADIMDDGPQKLFSIERWTDRHHTGMEILKADNFHVVVMYTVYRRSFLEEHNLRFLPHLYHEDNEFTPKVFYYLKDIISIDTVLYFKRVNYESITRTVNPKKNYDLVAVSRSLMEFADSLDNEQDRKFFMMLASNAFKTSMTNETLLMDKATRKKFNRYLHEHRDLLRSFFQSQRQVSKLEGLLLKIFSRNMLMVNNSLFHSKLLRKLLHRPIVTR